MTFLTIDAERVFLRFLEMAMRLGRTTKPMPVATEKEYEELFLEQLVANNRVNGLDADTRRRVLDGWIRAAVLRFEGSGTNRRQGRRLANPRPVHLGVIRSGLPSRPSDLIRHADVWTYYTAIQSLKSEGVDYQTRVIQQIVRRALGSGVDLGAEYQADEPRYDEVTPIDVTALLAMRLMSSFTGARPNAPHSADEIWPDKPWVNSVRVNPTVPVGLGDPPVFDRERKPTEPEVLVCFPEAFSNIGRDQLVLMTRYSHLDPTELIQHCLALLSLRLYQAPLIAAAGLRALLDGRTPERSAPVEIEEIELYCDFSEGVDSQSAELARRSVSRDLEGHRLFLRDRFLTRVLGWLVELLPMNERKGVTELRDRSTLEYFQRLVEMKKSGELATLARLQLQQFRHAIEGADVEPGTRESWNDLLAEWELDEIDEVTQLVLILSTASNPGGRAPAQQEQWCWTTGGLNNRPPHRPYALLSGSVKHRSTWKYSPSDQLLVSMLLGCFAHGDLLSSERIPELRFTELLEMMRTKYGILIDRPPSTMSDADTIRVAERNKSHFANRLLLLGCFDGLSDDVEFQMVRCPR